MTPVEKLEAAIAKLEQLRETTTGSEWKADPDAEIYRHGFSPEGGRFTVLDAHVVCKVWLDAQLIVTLHRTIDAQLALLKVGLATERQSDWTQPITGVALELASAILGDLS